MIRLVGGALLVLFGILLARHLAEREHRRVAYAEAYLDFLRYVRGELHAYARPLGEVYRRCNHPVLEENGFLPALRAGVGIGDAARHTTPPTDPRAVKILSDFGFAVGRGYLAETLACCDVYIERMNTYAGGVREAAPSRIRVRRTVALAGTALVLLLLL